MGTSRLTEEDVRRIRSRWALGGVTKNRLAREYGVDEKAIREVLKNATWKHVK
jgi:DNA-directed RNA polymerase sigma subunit (sigma70/sigma32)